MTFAKGDLVFGTRPWNRETRVGVVVESSDGDDSSDFSTFRVFWMNQKGNPFAAVQSFLTWEVADALRKVESDER